MQSSVDLAALLYLNPELAAYSNVATLSDAAAWVQQQGGQLPAGTFASTPTPPRGFEPRVFLAAQPDVSGLNEAVRLAMRADGLSDAAVFRRGVYVSTVVEDVLPCAQQQQQQQQEQQTLGFALADPSTTPFRFSPSNVRAGDWVRMSRSGGPRRGERLEGRVASVDVAGGGTALALDATTLTGARPCGSNDAYTLEGIRVWDSVRQALVAYARVHPGDPDPDDVVPRADFDVGVYHAVYPATRNQSFPDTYLDYRTHWRRNSEYRVINGRDIFNLSAPYTSNLLAGTGGGSTTPTTFYGGLIAAGHSMAVTPSTASFASNLLAGSGYLRVSPSNLTAGSNLVRLDGYYAGSGGGGACLLTVDGALGVAAGGPGALVVTTGGDVVMGGAASNLAVLRSPASVSLCGGALVASTASNSVAVASVLTVGERLGVGMECTGSESAAGESEWPGGGGGGGGGGGSTRLAVAGDIFATGTVVSLSDARVKADVRPIDAALARVACLSGYTYELHSDPPGGRRHTGLLAQEVASVLPEAVYSAPAAVGPLSSIAYGNMAGLFVEAIKELSARLAALEERSRKFGQDQPT
jgi:hypothetical protein